MFTVSTVRNNAKLEGSTNFVNALIEKFMHITFHYRYHGPTFSTKGRSDMSPDRYFFSYNSAY